MFTVLIVDDNHTPREIISKILQNDGDGIQVIEAANGVEAQEKIKANPPDLVITDLIMPEMNGYELCRWIRGNPGTEQMPILICSTKDQDFDKYWGKKQGGNEYITKPFSATDLLAKVNQLLPNKS